MKLLWKMSKKFQKLFFCTNITQQKNSWRKFSYLNEEEKKEMTSEILNELIEGMEKLLNESL